jgi:MOSC domain-containing protein YiiM
MKGRVAAVSCSPVHSFSKKNQDLIRLIARVGVEGDAHQGEFVQHRSRVAQDPKLPNLRQVHLVHAELFDELRAAGFIVNAGDIGENVTTQGLDLLGLPTGTRLHLGAAAVVEATGLRNPCPQLDHFLPGLTKAVLGSDETGRLIRRAGIMSVVIAGGDVRPGNPIDVELPPKPYRRLERI